MKSVKWINYTRLIKLNTFTKDDDYFRHNKKNLSLTFQMQLSKKSKKHCAAFLFAIYIKY